MNAANRISSFEDGQIKLTGDAVLNCPMAMTLSSWLHDAVQPAAMEAFEARVIAVRVAGSYVCRTRDNIAGAKMSEHAFGNAIDLDGFQIGGRWIKVGDAADTTGQKFIDAIRKKACGPFTTVLGPGSDSYHATHLHLDLQTRGKTRHALFCQ
jgi:hypothetical protein